MIRQAVTSTSRALRSSARVAAQSPLSRPQLSRGAAPLWAARLAHPAAVSRWYSATADSSASTESGKDAKPAAGGEAKSSEVPDAEAALKKQLETKDNEIKELKDKLLRSVADFRNLQDRTARDMKSARDFAIQKFAKDLVDSVDNLDRALSMVPQDKLKAEEQTEQVQALVNLYDGLKITEDSVMSTLKRHGLERFDPDSEKFNPNEHDATFMAPMPDKENNTVFHVQQKGWKLNGRVLRAAKVGVVKNA